MRRRRTTPRAAGRRLPLPADDGKKVVEIVADGVGKGDAMRRFLAHAPYAGRRPVFAGDDVTDEDGFRVVNAVGGYTIHIGDRTDTAARWRVPSVGALRSWLAGPVLAALMVRTVTEERRE